jgi:hypothetical protein
MDTNHYIVKLFSFNRGENYSQQRPELDLSHVYLHWGLSCTANSYVIEMMTAKKSICIKEYAIYNMKGSEIARSKKGVHIWFRRLM